MGNPRGDVLDPMRGRHQGRLGAPHAGQGTCQQPPMTVVETVEHLVEQQQSRSQSQRPGHQRQPSLAVRDLQHAGRGDVGEREARQQTVYPAPPGCGGNLQREVGARQSRCHDLLERVVPAVACVLVLRLRADIGHPVAHVHQVQQAALGVEVRPPFAAGGGRPAQAANELDQLRLAGAVGAQQQPLLSRHDLEVDLLEHLPPGQPESAAVQRNADAWHPQAPLIRGRTTRAPSRPTRSSRSSFSRCASSVWLASSCSDRSTSS